MEGYVYKLMKKMSIHQPEQLGIESVSALTKTSVKYWEFSSEAVRHRGRYKIFIDENLSSQAQWQDYGHEFYHTIGHAGSQLVMHPLFMQLQEHQANYFAYHFCVPTFMLEKERNLSVYKIMNLFNVEYDFALRRLEMYERKMINARVNNQARQ